MAQSHLSLFHLHHSFHLFPVVLADQLHPLHPLHPLRPSDLAGLEARLLLCPLSLLDRLAILVSPLGQSRLLRLSNLVGLANLLRQ